MLLPVHWRRLVETPIYARLSAGHIDLQYHFLACEISFNGGGPTLRIGRQDANSQSDKENKASGPTHDRDPR